MKNKNSGKSFFHQDGRRMFKHIGGYHGARRMFTNDFNRKGLPGWALTAFLAGYYELWNAEIYTKMNSEMDG